MHRPRARMMVWSQRGISFRPACARRLSERRRRIAVERHRADEPIDDVVPGGTGDLEGGACGRNEVFLAGEDAIVAPGGVARERAAIATRWCRS